MLKNPNYVYGPLDVEIPMRINFGDFILNKLLAHKDKVAIINENSQTSITYGRICQEAVNLALSLSRLGVRAGQTVAICSENRQEVWSAVVGVLCAGAIMTPINMGYTAGELTHVLNISKPNYIIASPNAYKIHEKIFKAQKSVKRIILFEEKPDTVSFKSLVKENVDINKFEVLDVKGQIDTAFIMYSSGTTGLPKGVVITHLNAIATLLLPHFKETPGLDNQPTVSITPWFHAMGLISFFIHFSAGLTIVTLDRFELDLYMKTIEKYKVSRLTVVPPILVALAKSDAPYDLSSVQYISCGAAPLSSDIMTAVKSRFPGLKAILQGYGMTESTVAIAKDYSDGQITKPGSVGPVVSGSVIKILDLETRKPLGPQKSGEICVKGVTIMKGYVGKDRKEDFDDEGFFATGDIGYYDEDGYIYIVDRLKELIKYKGYQVPPAEIEAVLLQNESVRDVGVVGLADGTAGEVPLAFVVLQPGKSVSEKELQAFVAERLSNPKHLRGGVRFVNEIPKNPSGKILRRHLRALVNEQKSKL